jgi:hypothetical protein
MRLADALGAAGLIEGFEAGGWVRQVALSALPHAPDAELGLAPLCDALGEGDAGGQLLSAVHGIASQPPRQVEATDVTGYASCRAPLAALADQKSLPPGRRDLAHAALDALLSRQQSRN